MSSPSLCRLGLEPPPLPPSLWKISRSHSASESSLESEKAEGGWRGRGGVKGELSLEEDSVRALLEDKGRGCVLV